MRVTTFVLNFSLLLIYTKSMEKSTISNASLTTTTTSTLKSTNITDFDNSNITTSTMTNVQLPVDVLSGDILLNPNFVLARATRSSEDIFPSRARKSNVEKIDANSRKKRYSDYSFLESDIIPHFLYDRPERRNDEISRPHFKIYPVFPGK